MSRRKVLVIVGASVLALLVLWRSAGAVGPAVPDVISVMNAGFNANLSIVKVGMCAIGVSALC